MSLQDKQMWMTFGHVTSIMLIQTQINSVILFCNDMPPVLNSSWAQIRAGQDGDTGAGHIQRFQDERNFEIDWLNRENRKKRKKKEKKRKNKNSTTTRGLSNFFVCLFWGYFYPFFCSWGKKKSNYCWCLISFTE